VRQPVRFGKYLLLERISVGGMAEVFQAKSFGVEGFEKIIAIKRILPSMAEDGDFIQMFIDEAKIAGQLSHANICQIYELGKIGESHFIAMEYIWGKDLLQIQNRLRKLRQKMPVPMICFIASKVCEGLDYAHRKKDANGRPLHIIHRDVSPQNVLVSYEGEVKLIDFGIAKAAIRSSRTQAGVLKGKFGYMSPEQVRGLPLDRRSDLFAIGTLLYESLTGERLFANDSDFSTLEKVRNAEVDPPSRLNPKIPPELERIVMKALARNVEDRYQWANELQDDLHQLLVKMGTPYSPKQLSSWMKEAFESELGKERQQLDYYKKLGQDGGGAKAPFTDEESTDSTQVGGPSFDDLLARPAEVRPGAAGFGEEAPTEIFGEVESDDVKLPRAAQVGPLPADQVDTKPRPGPAAAAAVAIDDDEDDARAPGAPPVLPLQGPPSAPSMDKAAPTSVPSAPGLTSLPGTYVGEPRSVTHGVRPGATTLLRDMALGAGAAILVAALVAGAYLLGTRVLSQRVAARPTGDPQAATLIVALADRGDGEVFIGGERKGSIKGGEPLTIDNLPGGPVEIVVKRAGAADCKQSEVLDSQVAKVVTCRFARMTGSLRLNVLTEGATVILDKQEISPQAAAEPLIVAAGVPHEVIVKKDGYVPRTLMLSVHAGETLAQRVELEPLPPPRPEPSRPRPSEPRELLAPSDRPPSATPSPLEEAAPGYLVADTTPWARVIVDGQDTGKMTPVAERSKIQVGAGKHVVTFVVGEQRFSYTIMVEPGQDYVLKKDLPVEE
jgi:serine/threonine protein kinase